MASIFRLSDKFFHTEKVQYIPCLPDNSYVYVKSLDFEVCWKGRSYFHLRLIVHLKEDNIKCVSIESLYRAPFGSFLKREFGNKCANIYIEAPIEIRARREYNKKCYEAFEKGISGISYKEVLESVKMKDAFKESHKASNCKEIADYVIINDEKKDLEDFLHDVDVIVSDTIKGTQVSTCQVMRSSTK